jgi:hypothetical protein
VVLGDLMAQTSDCSAISQSLKGQSHEILMALIT